MSEVGRREVVSEWRIAADREERVGQGRRRNGDEGEGGEKGCGERSESFEARKTDLGLRMRMGEGRWAERKATDRI